MPLGHIFLTFFYEIWERDKNMRLKFYKSQNGLPNYMGLADDIGVVL